MTVDSMLEIVKKLADDGLADFDPLKAACWFAAMREADDMLDGLRAKDLASMIQVGYTMGPLQTKGQLSDWLGDFGGALLDDGLTTTAVDTELVKALTDFFRRR